MNQEDEREDERWPGEVLDAERVNGGVVRWPSCRRVRQCHVNFREAERHDDNTHAARISRLPLLT